jgi:hypothetical protein
MKKDIKVTNSNPNFIEIDFKDLDADLDLINSIDSKYEVLKLKTREVALLIGKYRAKLGDLNAFIASLSFNDYLEILKNTTQNGVFITEDNFDDIFKDNIDEAHLIIIGSLMTHALYSQKKSFGIRVNSTPAKISD